jgi:carbamoyl-phosphate synthase large subunit
MGSILITGGGCPGWYSVFTSVEWRSRSDKLGIVSCDISENTAGKKLADGYFVVPRGDDPDYTKTIIEAVQKFDIEIIVPLTDPELIPLALAKDTLEKMGCKVLVSEAKYLEDILNKDRLYRRLASISPKIEKCRSVAEVKKFMDLTSQDQSCFIKLVNAYGSRGTKKVISERKWLDAFDSKKPEEFGLLFPISHLQDILDKYSVIAVELLPGSEYSFDCVFDSCGRLIRYFVREREVIRNGICHTAKFVVDTDREFLTFIQEITRSFQLNYNINVQAKRDMYGQLKLLEINPRISGSVGSFLPGGADLVKLGLDLLLSKRDSLADNYVTPDRYTQPRSYRVSEFV